MDTEMSKEKLQEVLDRITRQVTEESAGIHLHPGKSGPEKDQCTVHVRFHRGFLSNLSLRADVEMFTRLARSMLQTEQITVQDLEDVAKEYFNVLCGHIVAALYKATHVGSRFGVPSFHRGAFIPKNRREQFVLNYSSDRDEAAQLAHHVPVLHEEKGVAMGHTAKIQRKEGRNSMAKRVMVVDDSRVQGVQIRKLLEGTDYEVAHYCRSGEDALAVYDEVKPDVVTMDIIMPGMDGLETAQAILEEYPEARIVMVSSLAYDETFDEAKTIGAKAFLDKPYDKEKLLAALDQALSGQ